MGRRAQIREYGMALESGTICRQTGIHEDGNADLKSKRNTLSKVCSLQQLHMKNLVLYLRLVLFLKYNTPRNHPSYDLGPNSSPFVS